MQFNAIVKYLRFSPYKLRPLVDVVRGKSVPVALRWLETYKVGRAKPIFKVIKSAAANALSTKQVAPENLVVQDIRVDQGPIVHYFKPGAMGRSNPRRKRLSHIQVILTSRDAQKEKVAFNSHNKEVSGGSKS